MESKTQKAVKKAIKACNKNIASMQADLKNNKGTGLTYMDGRIAEAITTKVILESLEADLKSK